MDNFIKILFCTIVCFGANCEEPAAKKALIVGATSGIGKQLAYLLAKDGYQVGVVGRRKEKLKELEETISTKVWTKSIDVSKEEASEQIKDLIQEMGGVDLAVISIMGFRDFKVYPQKFEDERVKQKHILDTDLIGFWRAATSILEHFEEKTAGHFVGISSMDALRGRSHPDPSYSASKAFLSRYLLGKRDYYEHKKIPINVTEVLPGFIETEWAEPRKESDKPSSAYWVATREQAAKDIFDGIKAKSKKVYTLKKNILVAWSYAIIPDRLFNWIGGY
jgi:short-subunit dehydrogenase